MVEITFPSEDPVKHNEKEIIVVTKELDIKVAVDKFDITKMDIRQDLELVGISSYKTTKFFDVATGIKRDI